MFQSGSVCWEAALLSLWSFLLSSQSLRSESGWKNCSAVGWGPMKVCFFFNSCCYFLFDNLSSTDEECPSETEDGKFADDLVPVRYLTAQHLAAIQGMPQVAYTQNPLAIQQQPQSAFGTAQSDFGTLQRGSVQNVVVQQPQTPSVAGNSTMVNGYSASELGRVLLTAQTVPKVLPFVPSPVSMQSVAGAMSQPAATAQWVTDTLPPLPNIPMRAAKLAAKKNLNMSSTTKTRVKRQKWFDFFSLEPHSHFLPWTLIFKCGLGPWLHLALDFSLLYSARNLILLTLRGAKY